MEKVLVLSFPFFLFLIFLEAVFVKSESNPRFHLSDAISNLSCGIFDQILNVWTGFVFLSVYYFISQISFFSWPSDSVYSWIFLFIAIDLLYYIFHRASHQINILWATHIVHHQSESYNLTVSLRQGTLATWVTYIFYLPLAFMGFSSTQFLVVHAVYQLYQFLVHTRLEISFGKLDWLIASPKLHQIHHAQNREYIDKNYGGFFIIWDRLFGSFIDEKKEAKALRYGVTTGLKSWSPLWANLNYLHYLWKASHQARNIKDKLRVWFIAPKVRIPNIPTPERYPYGYHEVPKKGWLYILSQLVLTIGAAFCTLLWKDHMSRSIFFIASFLILFSISNITNLIENRPWAFKLEALKYVLTLAFLAYFISQ